jgi:hypothetical protein
MVSTVINGKLATPAVVCLQPDQRRLERRPPQAQPPADETEQNPN